MQKERIFHVISNTHWDREWRFPFQKNRQMLVNMIDQVLKILENEPRYRAFHLDSQSVVLQDYLAIRPDKKDLIEKFVREERLLIGPWFILPEEYQVGGENLIRNLLLGHKICAEFGHVMKVGYSPFSWGQISQLPQIYAEFGIDVVMFYRGVNSLDSPHAEFIWEGADGTRVLTSRFSTMPRYNFYFYIYRPVIHNEQVADIEYKWTKGGLPFHFADCHLKESDYHLLQPLDSYYKQNVKPAVEAIIRDQADDFTTPHIFWAEGHDSSGPNVKTVQIIKDIAELPGDDEVVHSTLEDYAAGLKQDADYDALPVITGERRSSQYDRRSGNLYGYTTSARMYLKQMNFTAEKWLQFYAEPFNSIAGLLGLTINDEYLNIAWHLLLQNSAHDSIGGCSMDEIHEDMVNRYKQCREISTGVFQRACHYLAQHIDPGDKDENSIHLVALNPNTWERHEIVEAFVDIPAEIDRGGIALTDISNKEIPLQFISREETEPVLEQLIDRPMYFNMKRYHCYLDIANIPAFGYKTLHVKPSKITFQSNHFIARVDIDLPVLENQVLKIEINRNGSIDVLEKETGRHYQQLAWFYDEGEAGHAWVHEPVEPYVNTKNASPKIEIAENGSLSASVMIRHEMQIPRASKDRSDNGETVTMPIALIVQLQAHSRCVEIQVKLHNPAESHRLRLMFSTGIDAEYSYGEGQLDVIARSTERPDTSDWVEQPMYDYPMHHFVDISDGENGAAILVDGLKEYEILDDDVKTVAITLFRAFAYVIQPSSVQDYSHQKGSQCLGDHEYRLAFYPHSGNWNQGNVYQGALNFNNDIRLFEIGTAAGDLPPEISFLKIEPEQLIFSCLKQPQGGGGKSMILRLYNPTDENIDGKVQFFRSIKNVQQVTLEEIFIQKIELSDPNSFHINIGKKKIVTILLKF